MKYLFKPEGTLFFYVLGAVYGSQNQLHGTFAVNTI